MSGGDNLREQIEQTIEEIWSTMCKTTDDVRILTEKHGMEAIAGLANPTIDEMLSITERLDKICGKVLDAINGSSVTEYIDTRLLLNARQMYLHFQQMVLAYKVNNLADFLAARDLLQKQAHF